VPGLTAIAVPIFDIEGRVRHSLALTGPSVRVDPRDHELAEVMTAAGREISSRLGAAPVSAMESKLMQPSEPAAATAAKGKREAGSEEAAAKEKRAAKSRRAPRKKVPVPA
jgi:hypothetical protein